MEKYEVNENDVWDGLNKNDINSYENKKLDTQANKSGKK